MIHLSVACLSVCRSVYLSVGLSGPHAHSRRIDGTQRRIFLLRRRSCIRHLVPIQSGASTRTPIQRHRYKSFFVTNMNGLHAFPLLCLLFTHALYHSLKGGLDINNYKTTLPMNKGACSYLAIFVPPGCSYIVLVALPQNTCAIDRSNIYHNPGNNSDLARSGLTPNPNAKNVVITACVPQVCRRQRRCACWSRVPSTEPTTLN